VVTQANILLDYGLRARLTDFGLTSVMHETTGFITTSTLRGSLRWMAPELVDFEKPENARATTASDVYSLGVVWWEVDEDCTCTRSSFC
jgi:serine/threonine protein kinase